MSIRGLDYYRVRTRGRRGTLNLARGKCETRRKSSDTQLCIRPASLEPKNSCRVSRSDGSARQSSRTCDLERFGIDGDTELLRVLSLVIVSGFDRELEIAR